MKSHRGTTNGDGTAEIVVPDGDWTLTYSVRRDDEGALVVDQLSVTPAGDLPLGGVTSTVLRGISIPRLLGVAADLTEAQGPVVAVVDAYRRALLSATEAVQNHRPRTPFPDDLYVIVAIAYVNDEGAAGATKRIAAALSGAFDRPISPEMVTDWIRAARRRGFLEQTRRGRRAAAPGPRLTEWLAEEGR